MSKYCPKCKQNFSDSFEECVYCNTPLVNGLIEMDDVSTSEPHTMSDSEILEKYKDYRKNIESQIGHGLSDAEFLNGLKEAHRDSLVLKAEKYNSSSTDKVNIPNCPTCQSTKIKKVSTASKAGSVFMWGLLSQKVKKQWHCNNCGYEVTVQR